MSEPLDIRLDTPETNLEKLSFAEMDAQSITDWVAGLPLANTLETAAQLKVATAELALLGIDGAAKFECLEAVRPVVHYICSRLDRVRAVPAPAQSATSALDLLLNVCTAYKSIVLDTLPSNSSDKTAQKDVLPSSIHRLLSDLSRILLRALESYVQPPENFWWEINELYRLAETLELTEYRLVDDENHTQPNISIEAAYLRSLLMASCKSNQLQQPEIKAVFGALEQWVEYADFNTDLKDALLVVDLLSNEGPQYTQLSPKPAEARALHTSVIAYEIEAYLKGINSRIVIPDSLTNHLLTHLAETWSVLKPRSFKRIPNDSVLKVCIGLRATHYFLSGGMDFIEQLAGTDTLMRREVNPFLDLDYEKAGLEDDDPWSQAHDLKIRIPENPNVNADSLITTDEEEPQALEQTYQHYEVNSADTCPAGYRVVWSEGAPPKTNVGELVALREEKDTRWCVAAIRWIRQQGKLISMGVELLAPRAIPVAIRAIQKRGGPTDYARGLLLPEIKAIDQPATVITPRVPFVENQKIQIQRQGLQTTAQLLTNTRKTESFNQFTFRMLDGYLES